MPQEELSASIAGSPSTRSASAPGLGLGGRAGAAEAPWYVAAKDIERNALIVVQEHDHPLLMSDSFIVEDMHWLVLPDGAELECAVKTRYRQSDLPCSVRPEAAARWHVTLSRPARAVTPGQYAVFYADDLCLGGGVIAERDLLGAFPPPAARSLSYNSPNLFFAGGIMTDSFKAKTTLDVGKQKYEILQPRCPQISRRRSLALFPEDSARELAALRGRRERQKERHRGPPRLGSESGAASRDRLYPGARDHARLHRRALHRRPRGNARGDREARR